MPELPEVETVRRGLEPVMLGATITQAHIRRPDLRWPLPPRMAERLTGAEVIALRRRSKYILADLSTGETLIIHLGMSGRMQIASDTPGAFHRAITPMEKHDHVVFDLSNGARVSFNDARRFGHMDLGKTNGIEDHWLIAKIGPEPLGNAFDEAYLRSQLKGRNTPIKSALLDQRIVAGLGNIYVCEVLFRTGISPKRKAGQLSKERVSRLVPAIREVLLEAIEAGGSSLRDHRQTDGELGYFQHRFKVYDQEGEPCAREGCGGVVQRIVQSGRSSFYCARCQR
ncbi:MAG: bifunctional DNA-formamidopyrimidine glycosylase/DNA-(apurinic or apyrimidinic site) lyase [Pseudomonadota bacterium]